MHDLIKEYMGEHQRIIFNGDGYSEDWVKEAARRGLPNIKSMVEAAGTLTTDKAVKLFEKFGIFTKVESREEIIYETYAKTINIEANTMIDMAGKKYIPAVMKYTKSLADAVIAVKEAGVEPTVQAGMLGEVNAKLTAAKAALNRLSDVVLQAAAMADGKEKAFFYKDTVREAMEALRAPIDELEMIVDKDVWPVPSYGELTFEV